MKPPTYASPQLPWLLCLGLLTPGCGDDTTANISGTATSSGAGSTTGSGGAATGGAGGQGGVDTGGGGAAVSTNEFLYVANQNTDTISRFSIEDDGALTLLGDTSVDGPGPLSVDPTRQHLYAALGNPSRVVAYALDPASGSLDEINRIDLEISPVYLAVDHTEQHLFVASYGDSAVRVHPLDETGAIGMSSTSGGPTGGLNAHSIQPSPNNKYAFVPNTNSDTISQYVFDEAAGTLSANRPASVSVAGGTGPRHFAFHPSLDVVYFVNEHADSVTTYSLASSGLLTEGASLSTLPSGVNGDSNTCADVHITKNGKFLYASNRGHNSIAMFSVDGSGKLTFLGAEPTEPTPREFDVTPNGAFLYAAGQGSDRLAAYRIKQSGTLERIDTIDVGGNPSWVLAVEVVAPPGD